MPRYEVSIPGKGTFHVDSPVELSDAQVYAAASQEPEKKTGMAAALGKGTESLLSSSKTALQSMFGDATEAGKEGIKRGEQSQYADQVSLDKVKEAYNKNGLLSAAGEVARQVPLALAEQAPNIGASLAAGRLGAMAGAGIGSVVPGIGTGVGALVGGGLGAFAPSFLQQMGGNVERQAHENGEVSAGKAAGAAVPQALLDVAGNYIPMGKTVIGKMLGPEVAAALGKGSKEAAEKLAKESILKAVAKGTGIGALAEVPTEVTQQVLERLQAGLPLLSSDAFKEYGETAYQVGLLAPMGAAGRLVDRSAAKAGQAPQTTPGQAPIDALREAGQKGAPTVTQPSQFLSQDDLFGMATQPNGYGVLEQYKQQLLATPKTKEREAAVKQVKELQHLMNVEETNRKREAEELRPNDRGLPTPENSAFNEQPTVEETVEQPAEETPAPKVRKPRQKKGATNVLPAAIEAGTDGVIEPSSAAPVVEGLGVDSEPGGVAPAVQPEQPGVAVSEPPIADRNGSEGITGSTVELDGKQYKVVAHNDTLISLKDAEGNSKRLSRKGKLGQQVEAQLGIEPVVEQAPQEEQAPTEEQTPPSEQKADPFNLLTGTVSVEGIRELEQRRRELNENIKAIQPKKGAEVSPNVQSIMDTLNTELQGVNERIKEAKKEEDRVLGITKTRTKKEQHRLDVEKAAGDAKGGRQDDAELLQEIIQAVGRYNKEESTATDRRLAADYLIELVKTTSPKTAPHRFALKALRYAIDPIDVRPSYRTEYDSRTKDVEDDDTNWGSYRYQLGMDRPLPEMERTYLQEELDGKPLQFVTDWLAANAPSRIHRTVMEKAKQRMLEMQREGVKFSFRIVRTGDALPIQVANALNAGAMGVAQTNVRKGVTTADVFIPSTEFNPKGMNYTTIAHEIVHAVTEITLLIADKPASANTPAHKFSVDLNKLYIAVVDHLDVKIRKGEKLSEIEARISSEKGSNTLHNSSELLAWGLTDGDFQRYLETIPYKNGASIWSKFVEAIRTYLGMPARADTALSELLRVGEGLMSTPYGDTAKVAFEMYGGNSVAPTSTTSMIATPQSAAVAQNDAIGEKPNLSTAQWVQKAMGDSPLVKFRVKTADSLAKLNNTFTTAYAGKFRDALGNLNPMVLISRALDAARISYAAMKYGTIVRDADGMVNAEELIAGPQFDLIAGEKVSYQGVIDFIHQQAKATGTTYKALLHMVDSTLYGYREYHLRERNDQLETTALAFEARGKQREADNLREQKSRLFLDQQPGTTQINDAKRNYDTNTDIRKVAQMLDAIRFSMIDTMVATQRITEEEAQEWKDNKGYIPFSRLGHPDVVFSTGRGMNRGVAAMKNLKPFEGSEFKKSDSVVESFAGLMDWMTKESMKNEAAIRALDEMVLMGPGMAQQVPPGTAEKGKKVVAFKNGNPTEYQVEDPMNVLAFSLTDPQVSGVFKAFQKAGQVLRAGVTSMPPFALKQVADDIVRAYVYSGVKNPGALVGRILMGLPKAWFNEAFRKNTPAIKRMESVGIVGTYDFTHSSNLKNILKEAGAEKRSYGENLLHFLEAGAKASDMAVRQAIYDQVMQETGDASVAESKAREIINFSRRGSSKLMGQLISIIPFFNAYARGMDKLATTITGTATGSQADAARAKFFNRMGVLFSMGMAYALMMQDDDEYWAQPDYVRDANWILPWGKELGFTPSIPVPQELAFIFKAIPDRIVQYYKYQGTPEERSAMSILGELAKRGIDVYSSPNAMTPQVMRPIYEGMTNYSLFMKRPLESQTQLKMRPFERYGTSTSDTAKVMAQGLENFSNATGTDFAAISPIMIENTIRGVMGTSAGVMLGVMDMLVNPNRTDRPLHQSMQAQLSGASAFMKDGVGARFIDELYQLDKETTQVHNTYEHLAKSDPEKASQFVQDNKGKFVAYDMVHGIMKQVQELNKLAMEQEKQGSIPSDQRRAFMIEAKRIQNEMAKTTFQVRHIIDQADKQ